MTTSSTKMPRWIEYMPIGEVLDAQRNPKNHNVKMIRESMARFGIVETPALDERTGRLVAGHGRLNDWRRQWEDHQRDPSVAPPEGVTLADDGGWLVPVSRGWRSADDAEAEAYLITSNNTVIMGGWNQGELDAMLADLARNDFGLAQVTGYSAATLEQLLDATEIELPAVPISSPADDFSDAGSGGTEAPERPAPASWLPFYGQGDEVTEHADIPRTGATYAETPEEQAARASRIAAYQPRVGTSGGFVEMNLVYQTADRDEAVRLIAAAKSVLGGELKASEIILRALRTMAAVLDNRESDRPVRLDSIARHAGWVAEDQP